MGTKMTKPKPALRGTGYHGRATKEERILQNPARDKHADAMTKFTSRRGRPNATR